MMNKNVRKVKNELKSLSRRQFISTAAAAAAGVAVAGPVSAMKKPAYIASKSSKTIINGVEIGVIAPYAFRGMSSDVEEILGFTVDLGIGAVEMQNEAVEAYAGIPVENQAEWRTSVNMDKFQELRNKYNDAGVRFYAYKQELTHAMSDAEYDYTFNVAKTLGAGQLTMELPRRDDDGTLTDRIGRFAAKHQVLVAYHNHAQANFNFWDRAVWQSRYNGVNLDIGHYVAGTSQSPVPLIEKHWDRLGSLHLKDRQMNGGDNLPWGEGDTPIAEVLQLMRDRNASFQATIELEYQVPDGSDPLQEIARCLDYCRDALNS